MGLPDSGYGCSVKGSGHFTLTVMDRVERTERFQRHSLVTPVTLTFSELLTVQNMCTCNGKGHSVSFIQVGLVMVTDVVGVLMGPTF